MANRSYLYALDFDRTKHKRTQESKIISLSEYPYSIPLSFKILVSQDCKTSNSISWDYEHPIAIQGDFKKGQQKLISFLDILYSKDIFDRIELEKQIQETVSFLSKNKLENIILECGELYEMNDGKFEEQNNELFEQIKNIDHVIERSINEFVNLKIMLDKLISEKDLLCNPKNILSKLLTFNRSSKIQKLDNSIKNQKRKMWSVLGINSWSTVLYYQFENN